MPPMLAAGIVADARPPIKRRASPRAPATRSAPPGETEIGPPAGNASDRTTAGAFRSHPPTRRTIAGDLRRRPPNERMTAGALRSRPAVARMNPGASAGRPETVGSNPGSFASRRAIGRMDLDDFEGRPRSVERLAVGFTGRSISNPWIAAASRVAAKSSVRTPAPSPTRAAIGPSNSAGRETGPHSKERLGAGAEGAAGFEDSNPGTFDGRS